MDLCSGVAAGDQQCGGVKRIPPHPFPSPGQRVGRGLILVLTPARCPAWDHVLHGGGRPRERELNPIRFPLRKISTKGNILFLLIRTKEGGKLNENPSRGRLKHHLHRRGRGRVRSRGREREGLTHKAVTEAEEEMRSSSELERGRWILAALGH